MLKSYFLQMEKQNQRFLIAIKVNTFYTNGTPYNIKKTREIILLPCWQGLFIGSSVNIASSVNNKMSFCPCVLRVIGLSLAFAYGRVLFRYQNVLSLDIFEAIFVFHT